MGKTQFCRICRSKKNLKYTTKDKRKLNANSRASNKPLLTTPTLGNICQVCDERIQIFHRLDDGGHDTSSDVEIEVILKTNETMPMSLVDALSYEDFLQRAQRLQPPVIVDNDKMLCNIFLQKFDQKTQLQIHKKDSSLARQQPEAQIGNQFHTTYTPPHSIGGDSEGDEAEVVELLSSRESTPAMSQSLHPPSSGFHLVDPQDHRIVAIIDLDDLDENEQKHDEESHSGLLTPATSSSNELSFTENNENRSVFFKPSKNSNVVSRNVNKTCKASQMDEDYEIVFRKVDTEREKSPVSKNRQPKNYNEKELRLVASLSLDSSDSETEYSERKVQKLSTSEVSETTLLVVKKTFDCKVCKLKFIDEESVTEHERDHQEVKCTLCQVSFVEVKRLIHHMRRKHRKYNGDMILEKPRAGQNSCMTIRLRYMQRTTFYECQLCGRIDDVFREHREHIIEKHPNESKSGKDPIIKQLKCPVCEAICGAQYLSLCRHIISSHGYRELSSRFRLLLTKIENCSPSSLLENSLDSVVTNPAQVVKVQSPIDFNHFGLANNVASILTSLTPPSSPPQIVASPVQQVFDITAPTIAAVTTLPIDNNNVSHNASASEPTSYPVQNHFVFNNWNNHHSTTDTASWNVASSPASNDSSNYDIILNTQKIDGILKTAANEFFEESETQSSVSTVDYTSTNDEWMPSSGNCSHSQIGSTDTLSKLFGSSATKKRTRPYGRGIADRKKRKKEQNKNAASRYRQKKKLEMEIIEVEEIELSQRHEALKRQLAEHKREAKNLKRFISECYGKKN